MKAICSTLILLILSISGFTQELISSSGDHFESNGLQLDFSLGETMTETFESDLTLTQGFHQTLLITTAIPERNDLDWVVGPNPVFNVLNVQIGAGQSQEGIIEIRNMHGQLVYSEPLKAIAKYQLDLSHLATGMYVLRVISRVPHPSMQNILIQKL